MPYVIERVRKCGARYTAMYTDENGRYKSAGTYDSEERAQQIAEQHERHVRLRTVTNGNLSHTSRRACVPGPGAQSAHRRRRGPGTFGAHHVAICPEAMRIAEISAAGDRMRGAFALVREMLAQDRLQADSSTALPERHQSTLGNLA